MDRIDYRLQNRISKFGYCSEIAPSDFIYLFLLRVIIYIFNRIFNICTVKRDLF